MHIDGAVIGIVGATGVVGRELIGLLGGEHAKRGRVRLCASDASEGVEITVGKTSVRVESLGRAFLTSVDVVFFAAGATVSRRWAPIAVDAGCLVIDCSSAFRMDPAVPLVIPGINSEALGTIHGPGIIANPNCAAIIALIAATPIRAIAGVERMVLSTYQAISGAGRAWMNELERQTRDVGAGRELTQDVSGRQLVYNIFNHDSAIGEDGYNGEERKIIDETRKIWNDDAVMVSVTCVRVPVVRAHCVAVNLTLEHAMTADDARTALLRTPGVRVVDDRINNHFPEPIDATGQDDVLVGRIRADAGQPAGLGLELFASGDQLRIGAATNALRIWDALRMSGSMA